MATYHKCPNCGNTELKTSIYQCKECHRFWCYKQAFGGFGSGDGCSNSTSKCQHCEAEKGFFDGNVKYLGQIED